jgi:aspartate beta-hydroxylase
MSVAETTPSQSPLVEARALMAAGRIDEAVSLYRALVESEPRHVEARNALAVVALRRRDLADARTQLAVAQAAAPDDALTLSHLAQLQQAEGDAPAAIQTYRRLLARQPQAYAARLAYARLLEDRGDADTGLRHAFRAIRQAHAAGRWLSEESTPPGLRAEVRRAVARVGQHRRALCMGILDRVAERHGRDVLGRAAAFVAIQLGDASYAPPDARQKPQRFPFPDLPQTPYYDKRRFEGVAELEAQTPAILAELRAILGGAAGRETVFSDPKLADAYLSGDRGPAVWDGYYFYRHGLRNETNAAACPQTMAAIDRLPLARVRGHGPEVLFSTLGPGTHLKPHHGVINARVTAHLPLIVPPGCALRVAGQEHAWRVGEVVAFDDTYLHEAWNHSDQTRVVMIFDMWHPDLTEAERLVVREVQEAFSDFGSAVDEPLEAR